MPIATTARRGQQHRKLVRGRNFPGHHVLTGWPGPPFPIGGHFSCRASPATRSNRPQWPTIMRPKIKSCMETSTLAGAPIRARRAEGDFRPLSPNPPIRLTGPVAAQLSAPELGAGEQFRQFRVVSGREQDQPVQHAADGRPPGRQAVALARPAGDPQAGLVEPLDEAEAGPRTGVAGAVQQRHRAELAVDDARPPPVQPAPSGAIRAARSAKAGPGFGDFTAGTVDFQLGDRPCRPGPTSE